MSQAPAAAARKSRQLQAAVTEVFTQDREAPVPFDTVINALSCTRSATKRTGGVGWGEVQCVQSTVRRACSDNKRNFRG